MDVFHWIEVFHYRLSVIFFYPVIIVLFFLLLRVFYSLGIFCREGWSRLLLKEKILQPIITEIKAVSVTNAADMELRLSEILQNAEQKSHARIQRARYSIKMGPTLGLVGTLTPMAKALNSLSQGNLAGLSGQMITAFSTTVLGLIIGGIAYSMAHIRAQWQRRDLLVLARLAEETLQNSK